MNELLCPLLHGVIWLLLIALHTLFIYDGY